MILLCKHHALDYLTITCYTIINCRRRNIYCNVRWLRRCVGIEPLIITPWPCHPRLKFTASWPCQWPCIDLFSIIFEVIRIPINVHTWCCWYENWKGDNKKLPRSSLTIVTSEGRRFNQNKSDHRYWNRLTMPKGEFRPSDYLYVITGHADTEPKRKPHKFLIINSHFPIRLKYWYPHAN